MLEVDEGMSARRLKREKRRAAKRMGSVERCGGCGCSVPGYFASFLGVNWATEIVES